MHEDLRNGSQTETKLGQAAPTAWNVPWPRQNLSWRTHRPTSCGAADGSAWRSKLSRNKAKEGKIRQVLNIAQFCPTLHNIAQRTCHQHATMECMPQKEGMNSNELSTSSFNILAAVAVAFGARNAWIYRHQNRLQILELMLQIRYFH